VTLQVETLTTDLPDNVLTERVPLTAGLTSGDTWPRLRSGAGVIRFEFELNPNCDLARQTLTVQFSPEALDDTAFGVHMACQGSYPYPISGIGPGEISLWKVHAFGPSGQSDEVEIAWNTESQRTGFAVWIYYDHGNILLHVGNEEDWRETPLFVRPLLQWHEPSPPPDLTRVTFHGFCTEGGDYGAAPILTALQIYPPRFLLHGGEGQPGQTLGLPERAKTGYEHADKDMHAVTLQEFAEELYRLRYGVTYDAH